jgi:hypothetical protein
MLNTGITELLGIQYPIAGGTMPEASDVVKGLAAD